MIFESSPALRKSDLILLEELPAKQLVWRQTVHDRGVGDRAATNGFAEHDARNTTLDPGHLRQHDVGSAAGSEVVQPLECLSAKPVVMIAEEHVFALSCLQAD